MTTIADHTSHATALIVGADRGVLTYARLHDAVGEVSRTLLGHGLRTGDVVAVLAENTVEFVVALLGAARAGLVVAPMDPALPEAGIRSRLDMSGARVVLAGPVPAAESLAGQRVWKVRGLRVHADGPPRTAAPPVGLTPDDVLIMFTSGTTGTPKMVPWTRQALGASVATIAHTYGLTSGDATVAVMPLFHGHGLVAALLTSLSVGAAVLLPAGGRFSAGTFWDDMAAAGATWCTAVPTIHRIVLDRVDDRDVGALRFVRSCSAPLAPELAARMESVYGVPVLAAYGMTEATHHVTGCTPADSAAVRRTTVGVPTGATATIVDGEVWLSGPTVARGYLGDPARSDGAFTDGWLRTGDLGTLDDRGNLAITGRIKNVINRGGEKISPEHVEQILAGYPGVAQAAVFGMPDTAYGERVAAAVVAAAGTRFSEADLGSYTRTRLAKYEVPERLSIVERLPLTAKGDVDRTALREAIS